MKCKRCKKEYDDAYSFCPYCGTSKEYAVNRSRVGNGQGTVVRIGERNYKAIAVVGWKDKKHPIRITKQGFRTKTDARKAIPQMVADYKGKVDIKTVDDYWKLFCASAYLNLSKASQKACRTSYKKLEKIKDREISSLRLSELQSILQGYNAPMQANIKRVLVHLYKLAVLDEAVLYNLASNLTISKHESKDKVAFTDAEVKILWKDFNAEPSRDVASILLMIYTGMMPSELLTCKASDVDLDARQILNIGKKTKKRKIMPIVLHDIVIPVVRWLMENAGADGRLMPLQDAQYRVHFDRVLSRLGMDGRGLTPYSCRHTTATMFAMKVDPNTLKELMRHSSIDMQEHYKHTTAQEVLDKINELALWH